LKTFRVPYSFWPLQPKPASMADLDDFFAKKDKKKRGGKKGFSKANADILAKNMEENERREQKAEEKASPLATTEAAKAALEESPVDGVSTGQMTASSAAVAAANNGSANGGTNGVAGGQDRKQGVSSAEEGRQASSEASAATQEDRASVEDEGGMTLADILAKKAAAANAYYGVPTEAVSGLLRSFADQSAHGVRVCVSTKITFRSRPRFSMGIAATTVHFWLLSRLLSL